MDWNGLSLYGTWYHKLASFRRIPLTIVRDQVETQRVVQDQVRTLFAIACDPYVAGSDIIGEKINDIRDLQPLIRELVSIAKDHPGFAIRIHAGENDSLKNNVAESLRRVKEALAPGQTMPAMRIGQGLNTANLHSRTGRKLIEDLRESDVVLEFQLTSNVRLNNLRLVRLCRNRFEIYAMVPSQLTEKEAARLKKSGVGIRISIESVGMGLYKSNSYELFKRRPSVVIGLDGNSTGTNVIQEARNGNEKPGSL